MGKILLTISLNFLLPFFRCSYFVQTTLLESLKLSQYLLQASQRFNLCFYSQYIVFLFTNLAILGYSDCFKFWWKRGKILFVYFSSYFIFAKCKIVCWCWFFVGNSKNGNLVERQSSLI